MNSRLPKSLWTAVVASVLLASFTLMLNRTYAQQAQPATAAGNHYTTDWKAPATPNAQPPLGTILPFYGDPQTLAGTGWIPCDGQVLPDWAAEEVKKFILSHSPQDRGNRVSFYGFLPNLNAGRFLRGVNNLDPAETIGAIGGRDRLEPAGEHTHGYNDQHLRLGSEDATPLYHHQPAGKHDHGDNGENRPPYMNITYIMRIK